MDVLFDTDTETYHIIEDDYDDVMYEHSVQQHQCGNEVDAIPF
jgi:hypothetical protein